MKHSRRKTQRRLHVYKTGDPYREGIRPQIRLTGRWLHDAGFLPGDTYTVTIHHDGVITLQTERSRLRETGSPRILREEPGPALTHPTTRLTQPKAYRKLLPLVGHHGKPIRCTPLITKRKEEGSHDE